MTASNENDECPIRFVEDEQGKQWLELPDKPVAIPQCTLCHHCGYELGGLRSDHRCPECGAPTMISLAGKSLIVTNPYWIEKVLRGTGLIIASPLLMVIPAVASVLPWFVAENPSRVFGVVVLVIAAASYLAVMLASIRGIWLFTTPHASFKLTNSSPVRPAVRVAAIAVPISAILILANVVFGVGIDWPWIVSLGAPFGLTGAIGANAMCIYSSAVGKHIHSDEAVGRCRPYRYGVTIGYVCAALALFLVAVSPPPWGSVYGWIILGFGLIALILQCVFGALIYMYPHLLANQLAHASHVSRWVWDNALEQPELKNSNLD